MALQAFHPDPAAAVEAASNIKAEVEFLHNHGAQHFLVMYMPDIGKTPCAADIGKQSLLSLVSHAFNNILYNELKDEDFQVIFFNTFNFLDTAVKDKQINIYNINFKFTNVTSLLVRN